ncbi:hypothetical protein [uncultured Dysosmobacter sp.]|uniref:hypothetical protein n=1 Tax=uncultured Dysosmobacter sp. TaxID=2591384 RepID=UPI00260BC750|nr:hypothetical protein [uncultured Dysosmobacter sp.]
MKWFMDAYRTNIMFRILLIHTVGLMEGLWLSFSVREPLEYLSVLLFLPWQIVTWCLARRILRNAGKIFAHATFSQHDFGKFLAIYTPHVLFSIWCLCCFLRVCRFTSMLLPEIAFFAVKGILFWTLSRDFKSKGQGGERHPPRV